MVGGRLAACILTGLIGAARCGTPTIGIDDAALNPRARRQTFPACSTSVLTPAVAVVPTSAYENCTAVVVFSVQVTVTTIESRALFGCTSLRIFQIPNTITHALTFIGADAFAGCTVLALNHLGGALPMPNRLVHIGDGAFSGCTSVLSAAFPDTLERIGTGAFAGATGLASVSFGNTTAQPLTINASAFSNTALTALDIPSRVTIDDGAFANIATLHTVHAGPMQQAATGVFASCGCGVALCPTDVTLGLVVALCNCVVCGPTIAPTAAPTTAAPSAAPTTATPTQVPTTTPTNSPTGTPTSAAPTGVPTTGSPVAAPTEAPTSRSAAPTTSAPVAALLITQGGGEADSDESEIPNYDTIRQLALWILVAIGVCCLTVLLYSARQWKRMMKRGMMYVQLVFNVSKVGILIYAVQKPASGPAMFSLSFITLIAKIQETLSLFDSSGASDRSPTAITLCAAGTFLIYCTTLACLAVPTVPLAALLWLNAATMLFDSSITHFILGALRETAEVASWKLTAYTVVQRLASAGSIALACYATLTGSEDVRLPLGDALIFVVANAAVQLFLDTPTQPKEDGTAKPPGDNVATTRNICFSGDEYVATAGPDDSLTI